LLTAIRMGYAIILKPGIPMEKAPILSIKMVMANAITGRMPPIVKALGTVVVKEMVMGVIMSKEMVHAVVTETAMAVGKASIIATAARIRKPPRQLIHHQETRKINF